MVKKDRKEGSGADKSGRAEDDDNDDDEYLKRKISRIFFFSPACFVTSLFYRETMFKTLATELAMVTLEKGLHCLSQSTQVCCRKRALTANILSRSWRSSNEKSWQSSNEKSWQSSNEK